MNVGCIPSKALLDSSHNFQLANSGFEPHGINLKSITIDVRRMLARKEEIVSGLTKGVESLFKLNKVESMLGKASVSEKGKVVVEEPSGNTITLSAENIIIATGSTPILLPFIECDGDKIVTSGGIIGTINKVADNRELTLEVAENVEIKIASGMVADLYEMPEVQKKEPPKEENKSKSGFSLFSRKK